MKTVKSQQELYAAAHPRSTNISAFDFTKDGQFRFGLDRDKTVATLRSIADRIEAGEILPQRVQVTEEASHSDYLTKALIFGFIEKAAPAAQELIQRQESAA